MPMTCRGSCSKRLWGERTDTYTYDGVGNILTATKDGVAHTYTYGDDDWGDLLTAYDGNAITYDAIGNPLTYYNGQSWNFTWVNGRTLSQAVSGDTTVSYVYDKTNGLRLSKTVGDVVYEYFYADSRLMRMTISDKHGQHDATKWTDITAVAADTYHVVGLKTDGTVVAAGLSDGGRCAVEKWKNIRAIGAGYNHTLGVKENGTVVATGSNKKDQCRVGLWKNPFHSLLKK